MTFVRRTAARLAALSLGAGLVVTLQPAGPAFAADPVAGGLTAAPADSLFPNQGNSGYDATHYDINFKVDVTTAVAAGALGTTNLPQATATIDAVTTGAPLSSYSFDFQGSTSTLANATLNVDSVTVNGSPATFSRIENTTTSDATTDNHKLIVTPATPVDGAFTTVVSYSGRPVAHTDTDGSSEGWNNTTDGATFLNQPVGAMTLFPNNNTPRDKATYRFTVDAPAMLKTSNYANAGGKPYPAAVASNGELVSVTPNGDGTRKTWVWNQAEQMASELSMISIGRYDMYTSNITLASGRTLPEWTFIDPAISVANQTTTQTSRARLKQIIDFFETKYGPYPGNSVGFVTDVVPSAINYALETQDRSFFPNSANLGTTYHEVMHQWFGNAVSPTDWNDISLSEGSARYSESQVAYEAVGLSTAPSTETAIYNLWNSTAANSSTFAVAPAALTLASQLFGAQSYNKGAMTLEALRTSIGAADYETLMRQWQLQYGGGVATVRRTAQFQALAESISGRDLTAFFHTWWFTAGKPAWPFKHDLSVAGPTTQVTPGDAAAYTLSVRNTGKVAMTPGQAVVTVDAADLLDDATLGALPAGVTLDGTTLTWSVPATALTTTSSVTIPVTVNAGTTGATLRAVARASTLGSTCLECASSVVVGAPFVTPAPVPTITGGVPTVGTTLSADTTGWADGTSFAYQWMIDGTPVPGATASTYTPTGDVVGLVVTVRVTGTLGGANPTSQTSAATPVGVRATPPVTTPTISGTPKIGVPLTVDPGTWPAGTFFTYVWRANGTAISGATGPTYTPAVAAQVGQTLTVDVIGTKFGNLTTTRTSAATAAVAAGDALVSTPTPVVSGTPKVGVPFAPDYGSWDDGVTLTFQWRANGTNIGGATAGSLTPAAAQVGQTLDVVVTGTKPGITPVVRTSNVSVPVEVGTQTLQPTPTITGTPRAGSVSTGVQGIWDTGTARTFQWYVDGVPVPGATTTSYTPTTSQIGGALTFEVTSTRPGYTTVVKSSAPSTIAAQLQTATPTPTITGTPQVGTQLTGEPGTWDDGTTLTYQWSVDGTPVEGATGLTYTPVVADLGELVTFAVTSTRATYETVTRTSAPSTAVAPGDQVLTPVPTITGTPQVGVELTAVPGTWDAGSVLTYQWSVDSTPVDGATDATYVPRPVDIGKPVAVAVTGTRTGYTPVTRTSDPTAAVVPGDLAPTPDPTITGIPKVGVELTGVPGTWDDGAVLTYQWLTDGTPVDGATGLTYTPGPGQAGAVVTLAVTGTRTGYDAVTRTSAPTVPVALGDQGLTPTPTVTGTPKVGVELTGVPGTWDDGAVLTYQWFADGAPVDGATGLTYTPGPGRVGAVVSFAVTGTEAGYVPATRTSSPSAPVLPGEQTSTPTPTITGTAKVGVELTAVTGDWDGATLTYEWTADGTPVATTATYVPGPAQLGRTVAVAVTGTRAGFDPVTRTSSATAPVAPGDQTSTPVPTISGDAQVPATLLALPGTWDVGVDLTYQWLADGSPIDGATGSVLTLGAGQVGQVVTVAVTGTRLGYTTVTRTSTPTAPVAAGDQVLAPTPTVSGTPQVGVALTGVPGTWDAGTALSYQWLADGVPVGGATGLTFTPDVDLVGDVLTFAVTSAKPGFVPVARTSAGTVPVALGSQVRNPTPIVRGVVRVGEGLTAVPGAWDAGTTLGYRWLRDGEPIAGAVLATYVLRPVDRGSRMSVTVTARKAGYADASTTSARTAAVTLGSQDLRPTPVLQGTAKVGRVLTIVPGAHDTGVTLTYRWFANGVRIAGASARTFTLKAGQVGKKIKVTVVASKPGYAQVSRDSKPTAPVVR